MKELEKDVIHYFLEPKELLCYAESKALVEKGEDSHPQEIYVEQVPTGIRVYRSKDTMVFKDHTFDYSSLFVLATCSKCGALNQYAIGFWHDKEGSHFKPKKES